jgi:hypothetical protein
MLIVCMTKVWRTVARGKRWVKCMVQRKWQTVAHGETDIAEGTWAWDLKMIHQLTQGINGMGGNRV